MLSQGGSIPFHFPTFSKPCHTWFKMIGNLESNITPLVILHGGPGACHEYLLPIEDLNEHKGIPIIFYDQIGNGRSTHFKEKEGDEEFWSEDLFRAELDNLIDYFQLRPKGFDLYGHSWGGMFGSKYAAMQPRGLRKLVLADAPASVHLMLEGEKTLRAALPRDVQEVLTRCEEEGRMDSEEYENACEVFYKRYLCRLDPWPKEVETALGHMKGDPTVYGTLFGPSELVVTGSLRNWTVIDQLHSISADTLLLNGRYDEIQDVAVRPFFEYIRRVKWVTLENSSHMGHLEERQRRAGVGSPFNEQLLAQGLLGSHFGRVDLPLAYDYVVIGGGTAGLTIARRLVESHTVVIIEAGSFYELSSGNLTEVPADTPYYLGKDPTIQNPLVDWMQRSAPQPGFGGASVLCPQGRTLGGSSARNFMWNQSGSASSYQKWADAVGDESYAFSDFLTYLKKSVGFEPPNQGARAANAPPQYNKSVYSSSEGPRQVSYPIHASPAASWLSLGLSAIGLKGLPGMKDGNLLELN